MAEPRRGDVPKTVGNGRYTLTEPLGEGGMASVWRCIDTIENAERAIKILHRDVAERKSYRSRFLAEAQTMSRLRHPNVLTVYDVGEEDGRFWFTAEIVEGGALIDILEKQGKLQVLESLDIAFQLLQGLSAAHAQGVVHRDVKPDNVLLAIDGRVKLSDFGIARVRHIQVQHRTRTGVSMGTVGYMAPEQRENARDVGPAADLYAAAATMYAVITGFEPPDLFASHVDPRLLELVPAHIRPVIQRATALRPEDRYPDARAMAADVAAAYDRVAADLGKPQQGRDWMDRFDSDAQATPRPSMELAKQAFSAPPKPTPRPGVTEKPRQQRVANASTSSGVTWATVAIMAVALAALLAAGIVALALAT